MRTIDPSLDFVAVNVVGSGTEESRTDSFE